MTTLEEDPHRPLLFTSLHLLGIGYRVIGRAVGVSRTTVYNQVRRLDLNGRPLRASHIDVESARAHVRAFYDNIEELSILGPHECATRLNDLAPSYASE